MPVTPDTELLTGIDVLLIGDIRAPRIRASTK